MISDFKVESDPNTGRVRSVRLYGKELLDPAAPSGEELKINGVPLPTRLHEREGVTAQSKERVVFKGERFVDHLSGWGVTVTRTIGSRSYARHPCIGVQHTIRREAAPLTLPSPGPGGPVVEAPMYVDTFSVLNWNWKFWGDHTRMMYPSGHSCGPADEFGHVGYEHDTPENCKKFMQNVWRRIYPGTMLLHGGLFYDAGSGQWLSITCRRPHVGYILNIENAGRGVAYDFTLHAPFGLGEVLPLPEIVLHFGPDRESMMRFLGDYITFYYQEPPEWVFKTLWSLGANWNNRPSWTEQAEHWEEKVEAGQCNGIHISLVTDRLVASGTAPKSYRPDPHYGPPEEFRQMCRRMADRGIPLIIWMSHSGLLYRSSPEVDDDWFIRGIDGRVSASWGKEDHLELVHVNPGHPGYIAYTKKWIQFYIQECGCKGIFLDCMTWAFPPDFTPRSFMRYPGDTNLMTVKFMEEIHAFLKKCDPEAILIGEGWPADVPLHAFSIVANPVRGLDGLGPRDFLLTLNAHAPKRLAIWSENSLSLSDGYCVAAEDPDLRAANARTLQFLRERGGSRAVASLPRDLAVLESDHLLFVPEYRPSDPGKSWELNGRWQHVRSLVSQLTGETWTRQPDGRFHEVPPGTYKMEGSSGGHP